MPTRSVHCPPGNLLKDLTLPRSLLAEQKCAFSDILIQSQMTDSCKLWRIFTFGYFYWCFQRSLSINREGQVCHVQHWIDRVPSLHLHLPQVFRPGHLPLPATDIWWSSLQTCSTLFTWGPTQPPRCWHLLVATETYTIGKRAVLILLEWCLVPDGSRLLRVFLISKQLDRFSSSLVPFGSWKESKLKSLDNDSI